MFRSPALRPAAPSRRPSVVALLAALVLLLAGAPVASADPSGPGVVQGVVRDVHGAPIAGAQVEVGIGVRGPDPGSWTGSPITTTTDGDGRYRIEGIVTPDQDHDVWSLVAWADGHASASFAGLGERLRAAPRTPVVADFVLRRLDVTLRGRASVRGGSAQNTWVTAELAGAGAGRYGQDSWSTAPDADGRWELRVPAGAYRISAQGTYGLQTWWPDVAGARPAPVTPTTSPGDVVDDLDISMRLRLPGPAVDEYGTWHQGWDGSTSGDPSGRYPRDPHRSVLAVRGPELRLGTPRNSFYNFPLSRLPAGELVTVTGTGVTIEVPVENSGDDVLWIGPARLEGPIADASTCRWGSGGSCADEHPVLPGRIETMEITPVAARYAPAYPLALVVPTSDGPERRLALRLRNVGTEAFGADDSRNLRGIHPYLSPEDQALTAGFLGLGPELPPEVSAWIASMTAPKAPAAPATAPAPSRDRPAGVVTVARSSVAFTFPAAGRVDVRIDRLVRSKTRRRPDRWARARVVSLRADGPGARSVPIRRLAVGPYRVRIVARIGGQVRRVTDYRDVKP